MVENGKQTELQGALDKIVAAFSRINTGLRTLTDRMLRISDSFDASTERREREFETLRSLITEIKQAQALMSQQIESIGGTVEKVNDRYTPTSVPLFNQPPSEKDDSGSALAIRDGKVKLTLPGTWAVGLLKTAMSAGGGALLLRGLQWIATGH